MKTIKVTIYGEIDAMEWNSEDKAAIEEFDVDSERIYGWKTVNALYVNDDRDNNLIKKKGKYINNKTWFHEALELPVVLHIGTMDDQELEYTIELEDDEEFDISKLQLEKSDYEILGVPYWIFAEWILYDGKQVWVDCVDELSDYWLRHYDTYLVKNFLN